MADFIKAYKILDIHEGGYSNDPDDAGRETYKGISRRFNPSWSGWIIIDSEKKSNPDKYEKLLYENEYLNSLVILFYKEHFWNKFLGDEIPFQEIANELFECGVNLGISESVKFLQKALNILNRNQKLYPDLVEDGVFGNITLSTLKKYSENDTQEILLKIMNVFQGMHYVEYMNRSPIQEKNARGWFERVKI